MAVYLQLYVVEIYLANKLHTSTSNGAIGSLKSTAHRSTPQRAPVRNQA